MAKTVVGFFENFQQAERAVDELTRSGFRRDDISIVANQQARESRATTSGGRADDTDAGTGAAVGATTGAVVGGAAGLIASLAGLTIPVVGPILAAGPIIATLSGAGIGAVTGGLIGALVSLGVPEDEAREYEQGVKQGGTLVTLKTDEAKADAAASIMNRNGAVDIKRRSRTGQAATAASTGSTTMQGNQQQHGYQPNTGSEAQHKTTRKAGEEVRVPVVEEEIRVGKREVETGGVRVNTNISEKPVEEKVHLHEEKVRVERRPTDRPATAADLRNQPGEQTFEVRETVEQPVVQKQARVVEEIVVAKEERDRVETVRDTVRRKDVDVEQLSGHRGDVSAYDNDFRSNYQQNFARSGMSYEQCSPAYRYGHQLAGDQRYQGKDWNAIQNEARGDWERNNPGTWDKFKDAVQYGWNRVRQGAHNVTH